MNYFIIVSIAALAIIAVLVLYGRKNKTNKKITALSGLAFAFVLAAIFFCNDRFIGYGLMGAGILLAIIDISNKTKKNRENIV